MLCYFEKGVEYRAPTSSEFTVLLCFLKDILSFICVYVIYRRKLLATLDTSLKQKLYVMGITPEIL